MHREVVREKQEMKEGWYVLMNVKAKKFSANCTFFLRECYSWNLKTVCNYTLNFKL